MLCAKIGWNWPSGAGEEDENVKSLQTDGQTDRQTTDDRWSEKLTWAFSSGELKMVSDFESHLKYQVISSYWPMNKQIFTRICLIWRFLNRHTFCKKTSKYYQLLAYQWLACTKAFFHIFMIYMHLTWFLASWQIVELWKLYLYTTGMFSFSDFNLKSNALLLLLKKIY